MVIKVLCMFRYHSGSHVCNDSIMVHVKRPDQVLEAFDKAIQNAITRGWGVGPRPKIGSWLLTSYLPEHPFPTLH